MTREIKEAILGFFAQSPRTAFTAKKVRDGVAPGTDISVIVDVLGSLVEADRVETVKSDESPNTQYRLHRESSTPRRGKSQPSTDGNAAPALSVQQNKSLAIRQTLVREARPMSPKEISESLGAAIDAGTVNALCCSMATTNTLKRIGSGRGVKYVATDATLRAPIGVRHLGFGDANAMQRAIERYSSPDPSFSQLLETIRSTRQSLSAARAEAEARLLDAALASSDPAVRDLAYVAHRCRQSLHELDRAFRPHHQGSDAEACQQ